MAAVAPGQDSADPLAALGSLLLAARDAGLEAAGVWLQRRLDDDALAGLGLLRRHRPVLTLGRLVVVAGRDDVLAVLDDPDTFSLPYAPRLPGSFVLGLSGEEHARAAEELREVFPAQDLDGLERLAAAAAERRVQPVAAAGGLLDVGTDLVHPVLNEVVGAYLGVPGPDPDTSLRWARAIFQHLFLNPGDLATIRRRSDDAWSQMAAYVDAVIAARKVEGGREAGEAADVADFGDDVLGRLLARQARGVETALTDAGIRDNLIGLAIGWLWHGAKAAVTAVDELLRRPDAHREAAAAARAGDLAHLRFVLWEVLRFRPVQAGLPRLCQRGGHIVDAAGTRHRIRPGSSVFVGTHSAMRDEARVPDPAVFDPDRAEGQYLIFGAGLHRCFGEQIVRRQLPALLAPLLGAEGMRRAAGRGGRLRYDGPAPDGFRVWLPRGGA